MAKKNKKKKSKKRTPLGYQLKMAMTDRYQAYGNYNPQVQHLVSRERPNLREIRMGLPLSRGLQGSSYLNLPEYGVFLSGGHMGNYMKQVENSRDAVDYSQIQEEALAIARELRTARLAIADERAAFEQAQMGVSAKDDNDDLTDYHQSGSDDEYTDAKSEAGPSWLIAQSPQQSDREIAAEERHVRNNSPSPTPKNLNPTIRAELRNRADMSRLISEQAGGATQGMRDVASDIAKYGDISVGSPAQNMLKQKRVDAAAKKVEAAARKTKGFFDTEYPITIADSNTPARRSRRFQRSPNSDIENP
jgi:hypothetical protein